MNVAALLMLRTGGPTAILCCRVRDDDGSKAPVPQFCRSSLGSVVAVTAWQMLFDHAHARAGQAVQWRAHRDLALAKKSIPGPNASSCNSHEDLPFVWRWLRHVVNPDHVGRTEFMNAQEGPRGVAVSEGE